MPFIPEIRRGRPAARKEQHAMLHDVIRIPPEFAERYRALGYWEDRTLAAAFTEIFGRYADRVAVIDGDDHVTYRQIDERSTHLARHLLDLGLRPSDRVVVQLSNTQMFVYLYFAMQKAGIIPVLALPAHRRREIGQFVEISGARACAVPASVRGFDYLAMVRELMSDHPSLDLCLYEGESGPEPGFQPLDVLLETEPRTPESALEAVRIDPDDPAVFLLSGGTTGIPKLIPRTHNDYLYNSKLAASVCDIRDGDVLLLVLPIEHNLPLACPGLQGFLLSGASVVLSTSTRPENVFRLVEAHRVTHIHVVPALLIRWLSDEAATAHDLSSVRIIQSGGQRLQPEVRRRAAEVLPGCFIQENFGMAEGLIMFVRADDPDDVRRETCGRPVCPSDEVKLVDEEGAEVPRGEVGELVVRGPYTLRGYYRAPEHNQRAFTPDGFYRSGDLLRMHPSGNYIVEGRRKDLINRGGEKISAEEVENLILTHPKVQNVACVPYPDPVLGERMCACLVLYPDNTVDLAELVGFLMEFDIAKFKLPERVEVLDELPLSNFGKVSKKELAARLAVTARG
jgi:2,3-dihydroxybenzoate-AMP ligase